MFLFIPGVFVYKVNKEQNEIVLMSRNTKDTQRHEINIPIGNYEVIKTTFSRHIKCQSDSHT